MSGRSAFENRIGLVQTVHRLGDLRQQAVLLLRRQIGVVPGVVKRAARRHFLDEVLEAFELKSATMRGSPGWACVVSRLRLPGDARPALPRRA